MDDILSMFRYVNHEAALDFIERLDKEIFQDAGFLEKLKAYCNKEMEKENENH
jgi:hypothetical protein